MDYIYGLELFGFEGLQAFILGVAIIFAFISIFATIIKRSLIIIVIIILLNLAGGYGLFEYLKEAPETPLLNETKK